MGPDGGGQSHRAPRTLRQSAWTLCSNVARQEVPALGGDNFPEFTMAIRESIADPTGWVEFGQPNQGETYLRITTGCSQGKSPCMPFVMGI
jgi:hypothetical protein